MNLTIIISRNILNKVFFLFILIIFFLKIDQSNIISIKNKKGNNYYKVCLCVICKEENLYIKYFIDKYKRLGFNHIFIYDNNEIDGENIEKIVMEEINQGFIKSIFLNIFHHYIRNSNHCNYKINYRGYRGNVGGPQMAAYFDCYKRNYLFYDFIAFFDVDEYLELNQNNNIQEFLSDSRFDNCEIIKINWKVFSDDNKLKYEDKPLNERFTKAIKLDDHLNTVYKLIIRGNISKYFLKKIYNPHEIFESNKTCDSNGKIRKVINIKPPEYKLASLNHYYTKTIKEYCQKIKKGDVFYNRPLGIKLLRFFFNSFFSYNEKTKEKISIFNEEFNLNWK